MRLYMIGNGNFFSEKNDSQIIEAGRYYLKDCPRNLYSAVDKSGKFKDFDDISLKDVNDVIITHTHEDHIGSLGTLLLTKYFVENKKVNLYSTSKTLDEINDILANTIKTAEFDYKPGRYFDHIELEPGVPYVGDGISIETRYNLHPAVKDDPDSVVTDCAIGLKFSDGKKTYADSGDTLYDVELIDQLHKMGKIDEKQVEELKGFLWDADLIAHEVGSDYDPVHTKLSELEKLDDDVKSRLWLKHIPDGIVTDIPILQNGKIYRV